MKITEKFYMLSETALEAFCYNYHKMRMSDVLSEEGAFIDSLRRLEQERQIAELNWNIHLTRDEIV